MRGRTFVVRQLLRTLRKLGESAHHFQQFGVASGRAESSSRRISTPLREDYRCHHEVLPLDLLGVCFRLRFGRLTKTPAT